MATTGWRRSAWGWIGLALLGGLAGAAQAAVSVGVSVVDDDGRTVSLAAPARRIVSLAPHATELLFAAGAGAKVVASVSYADYPEAARRLPRVGDAHALDLERIAALRPDLLVVWQHGSSPQQIERLASLKLPIFYSEPKRLAQIGDSLRRLGVLAGTSAEADKAAAGFETELAALRQQYSGRPPLRVFYQIWHQPLMTINKQQIISDVISLCGGVNVFADIPVLVPTLTAEAVLAARPQVLVSSSADGAVGDSFAVWQDFKRFEPVARQALVVLPADHISRPTPRLLLAARRLCQGLDQVRAGQAVNLPRVVP